MEKLAKNKKVWLLALSPEELIAQVELSEEHTSVKDYIEKRKRITEERKNLLEINKNVVKGKRLKYLKRYKQNGKPGKSRKR